ncbi:MAG: alpha/beta hydrolase fold domain-containing protein [Oscillospiraceae bacterium]|nr:alpha/beta hydrolase fold domain-containing protein [Oscillospiraceae bacterium]
MAGNLSEKFIRAQLSLARPIISSFSLETVRKWQDTLGKLMSFTHRSDLRYEKRATGNCESEWIIPNGKSCAGVILYLHGGGYTCGGENYAKGFGSVLASEYNAPVFCCAYRLAPENKFPCAVNDALSAYQFLLNNGYSSDSIMLCGESAGGGLCYSLCIKLHELGIAMPAGIIAISPWTDLTQSSESFVTNADNDPSMTKETLQYFADSYTDEPKNPLASPLFYEGNAKFPPSLIFVGGDEVMLDDSRRMHEKLVKKGCKCELVVEPKMWHAFLLYGLKEHRNHLAKIGEFIASHLPDNKRRWLRLDNAAKIFPASKRKGWYNMFRLSAELTEHIDPTVLQSALEVTLRRFPSVATRLRRGVFWYYLEEIEKPPKVILDGHQPLMRRPFDDVRKCAIRVLYYKNRIAVEFFHAVTDGTGGLVFLKSLVAEYITQKYNVTVSNTNGVLDRYALATEEELEDSFLKNTGNVSFNRKEEKTFRILGTPEKDGFLNLTCGIVAADKVIELAHKYGVTVTAFLTAVMIDSIISIQNRRVLNPKKHRPVKIHIPVNLRKLYGSKTMRNFVMTVNIGVDPRMGEYTFEELVQIIHHQMALSITPKNMQAIFTTNVNTEKVFAIKVVPLFLKNIIMRLVFDSCGDSKACLSISNLANVEIPAEMKPYVTRFDFIIGPQSAAPYNCGVCSYNGKMYINMIRNSVEPELEGEFFRRLVKFGLNVKLESNQRRGEK